MEGTRFYLAVRPSDQRQLRRLGRRTAILDSRRARHRSQGGAMRRSAQGSPETGSMQAVREGMHTGASSRRSHGFVGGVVRRVLQLRAPQDVRVNASVGGMMTAIL